MLKVRLVPSSLVAIVFTVGLAANLRAATVQNAGFETGDFTGWTTYSIEWRADFVTVSVNGAIILDTRKLPDPVAIPTVPMYLYVQMEAGPDGPIPAPNRQTPNQVTAHVDWVRYKG